MFSKMLQCMLRYMFIVLGWSFSAIISLGLYQMYLGGELLLVLAIVLGPPLLFTIIVVPMVFIEIVETQQEQLNSLKRNLDDLTNILHNELIRNKDLAVRVATFEENYHA